MKKVVFISSYPEKNNIHGRSTVGVASYAKNTVNAIKNTTKEKIQISVLAEKLPNESDYTRSGVNVKRVWERNSFSIFPNLIKELYKNHKSKKTVVFELELAMFGSIAYLIPLPIFLIALKLMGKKIIFVSHQVIPNIKELAYHINISEKSFTALFINICLRLFYRFVILISDKVIVFEKELKNRLSKYGSPKKIKVIPHGVEKFENIPTKEEARKKLKIKRGEFVAIAFGYLAWYKGSDWILDATSKLNARKNSNKISLILAGGPNPNHGNQKYYNDYIQRLKEKGEKNNIKITGFVPQKEISYYYQASDVVIFPYRTFMSSSGPLSITLSFKKPFIVSKSLKPALLNSDMKRAFENYRVDQDRITFNQLEDFSKKLREVQKNQKLRKKFSLISKDLANKRSWEVIGRKYYEEIFN